MIHAGLKIENDMIDKFRNYNLNYFRGAIIGEAELVDCIFIDNEFNKKLQKINSLVYEKDYVGNYAWKLDKVIKYDKPIYCKGQLGLWNYNIK